VLTTLAAACVGLCRAAAGGLADSGGPPGRGLIAFPGSDVNGAQQLYTIASEGSALRQITFEGDNSMPSWSPDGARLVCGFSSPLAGSVLTIMDADGQRRRPLTAGAAPDWGPSGEIAFCWAPAPGRPAEVFAIGADGGPPRQITSGGNHGGRVHPSWSPDGTRIVYAQLTPQDATQDDARNGCPALPFRVELWITSADGHNRRLLTRRGSSNVDADGHVINSADDANAPDWSPVGEDIAFWSGQEQGFGQIWRIRADGAGRTQLTHEPLPSHDDDPAWSSDGARILFSTDRGGRPELWVMDSDGANPRFIAPNRPGPGPADAAWQPVVR
jgi:Tol biopolymer transport system component